jgi:hypothetical protein
VKRRHDPFVQQSGLVAKLTRGDRSRSLDRIEDLRLCGTGTRKRPAESVRVIGEVACQYVAQVPPEEPPLYDHSPGTETIGHALIVKRGPPDEGRGIAGAGLVDLVNRLEEPEQIFEPPACGQRIEEALASKSLGENRLLVELHGFSSETIHIAKN